MFRKWLVSAMNGMGVKIPVIIAVCVLATGVRADRRSGLLTGEADDNTTHRGYRSVVIGTRIQKDPGFQGPSAAFSQPVSDVPGVSGVSGVCADTVNDMAFYADELVTLSRRSTEGVVQRADWFGGADAGAKVTACLAALGSTGGTCDARGLAGAQTIRATIVMPHYATVLLPTHSTWTSRINPAFSMTYSDALIGSKENQMTLHCIGSGSACINLVGGNNYTNIVENLRIRGGGTTDGSVGLDWRGGIKGVVSRVDIGGFQTDFEIGSGPYSCDCYNDIAHLSIGDPVGAYASIWNRGANKNLVLFESLGNTSMAGIGEYQDGSGNVIISLDCENDNSYCVEIGPHANSNDYYSVYNEASRGMYFNSGAVNNQVYGNGTPMDFGDGTAKVTNGANYQMSGLLLRASGDGSHPHMLRLATDFELGLIGGGALGYSAGLDAVFANGWGGSPRWMPINFGGGKVYGGLLPVGSIEQTTIADPAAPIVTVHGTRGSKTYKYALVCRDYTSRVLNSESIGTTKSSVISTITDGNATLNSTNYNVIRVPRVAGCSCWDILGRRDGATGAVKTCFDGRTYKDQGGSTSTYRPPGRNSTGDSRVAGMEISAGISWPLPARVVNGSSFYCPNCDPPRYPPGACTSAGKRTGSWVHGINGSWVCTD